MKKVIIMFLILIIVLGTSVLATSSEPSSFTINLTSNKTKLDRGEEVVITVSLSSLTNAGEGVNVFKANLEYDKNIFEEITTGTNNISTNIIPSDGWGAVIYNTVNQQFVTERANFVTSGDILQIKLKVKSNATYGNTTVSINNGLAATSLDSQINAVNKGINVRVQAEQTNTNTINNTISNTTNTTTNVLTNVVINTSNSINNIPTINTTNTTNSQNIDASAKNAIDQKLPQTGTSDLIFIPIAILAINAIIVFIKYRKEM